MMPENTNRLTQFWEELKRRKVVRVITVYAAAAFVTLELISIVADPLNYRNGHSPSSLFS